MKSSRSNLVIVVMGLGTLGIFGFLMKFAVDATPDLAKLGSVKQAFARDFSEEGLEEISIRSLPGRRGYSIRATLDEERAQRVESGGAEVVAREYAEYFVKAFEGRSRYKIEVKLIESPGFGCSAPRVIGKRDFVTARLRREMDLRDASRRLTGHSEPTLGLTIDRVTVLSLEKIRLEIVVNDPEDPPERGEEELAELVAAVRSFAGEAIHPVPVRRAALVLRSSRDPEAVLAELDIERPRAPRKRVHHKQPSRLDPDRRR